MTTQVENYSALPQLAAGTSVWVVAVTVRYHTEGGADSVYPFAFGRFVSDALAASEAALLNGLRPSTVSVAFSNTPGTSPAVVTLTYPTALLQRASPQGCHPLSAPCRAVPVPPATLPEVQLFASDLVQWANTNLAGPASSAINTYTSYAPHLVFLQFGPAAVTAPT
jgi:hypothetical protein